MAVLLILVTNHENLPPETLKLRSQEKRQLTVHGTTSMENEKRIESISDSMEARQDKTSNVRETLPDSSSGSVPPTSFASASDTQIWATITPSQSASLQALHQRMQQQQQQQLDNNHRQEAHNHEKTQEQTQQQPPSQREHTMSESPSVGNVKSGNEQTDKPPVGSKEWHRIRRENHKQVERRRRETINEGINEIARIVPGCEKNKGQILQRAAAYIRQLKENEAATLEKWTLEKLLTDQAINELNCQVEVLKMEAEKLAQENQYIKRLLEQGDEAEKNGKRQKRDSEDAGKN